MIFFTGIAFFLHLSLAAAFAPIRNKDLTSDSLFTTHSLQPTYLHSQASNQDFFDTHDEIAAEASHISDAGMEAAVMERALILAQDLMHRKELEVKQKEEEAKILEQQFAMLEETTKDMSGLFEAYSTNKDQFKRDMDKNRGTASLAIEILEEVIAETALRMLDLENEQDQIIGSVFDAVRKEEMAAAQFNELLKTNLAAKAGKQVKTEEIDKEDPYEMDNDFNGDYDDDGVYDDDEDTPSVVKFEQTFIDPQDSKTIQEFVEDKHFVKYDLKDPHEVARENLKAEWTKQWNQAWMRQRKTIANQEDLKP